MAYKCYYCEKEFEANRDTAKYCSNSCRTSANKQRRENELLHEKWQKEKVDREIEEQRIKDEQSDKRKVKAEKKRKLVEESQSSPAVVPQIPESQEPLQIEKVSEEITPQQADQAPEQKDTKSLHFVWKDLETFKKEAKEKEVKQQQELEQLKSEQQKWMLYGELLIAFYDKYV